MTRPDQEIERLRNEIAVHRFYGDWKIELLNDIFKLIDYIYYLENCLAPSQNKKGVKTK